MIVHEPATLVGIVKAENPVLDWNTLLGAAVGALLVFLFTEVREYRQRRRERVGLQAVLRSELDYNDQMTDEANLDGADFMDVVMYRKVVEEMIPLSEEAWVESRAKLAQLVSRTAFNELDTYYRMLQKLKAFPTGFDPPPPTSSSSSYDLTKAELRTKIVELHRQADIIRSRM